MQQNLAYCKILKIHNSTDSCRQHCGDHWQSRTRTHTHTAWRAACVYANVFTCEPKGNQMQIIAPVRALCSTRLSSWQQPADLKRKCMFASFHCVEMKMKVLLHGIPFSCTVQCWKGRNKISVLSHTRAVRLSVERRLIPSNSSTPEVRRKQDEKEPLHCCASRENMSSFTSSRNKKQINLKKEEILNVFLTQKRRYNILLKYPSKLT